MEKVLMIASVASMIDKFNMSNIEILEKDYKVDVAANFSFGSITSQERVDQFKKELEDRGIDVFNILIPRKIFDIKRIISAYKEVKQLCMENRYKIVHCHSPIGGVIARLACRKLRKKETRVIYTAHGFHFFKGAQLVNWMIYFPIEWVCSFFTDVLITINQEDYKFAQKYMHAKKVEYIPGVGVDTHKIKNTVVNKEEIRQLIGAKQNNIVVLSIGELNENKNHEVVIRAISKLKRNDITYVVCGQGNKEEYLIKLAEELGVELVLPGYRNDIAEICKSCDIFVFPSKREGLSVSLMEAMSAGLSVVCSDIRGNTDLIQNGRGGYLVDCNSADLFAECISKLADSKELRKKTGDYNAIVIDDFSTDNVCRLMEQLYKDAIK